MPSFKVAHIREQGVDLIIWPAPPSFGQAPQSEQIETIAAMQMAAGRAGLAGRVVPMWDVGDRVAFIAPPNWHPFFRSITGDQIRANLNVQISW